MEEKAESSRQLRSAFRFLFVAALMLEIGGCVMVLSTPHYWYGVLIILGGLIQAYAKVYGRLDDDD